jgi:beta-phosphoglucomutase
VSLADFRPRGVVLDLDGTVLDNMPVHAEAFAEFCRRHGLPPFTEEMRLRLDGKRNRDIFPVLFERELSDEEHERLAGEKESLYRELSAGRLTALRGLPELLDACARRDIPVAVATSAPEANVRHTLQEIGLGAALSRVLRSDNMPRGKPFPDVFLAAAREIGVDPQDCLAFEDAPAGVRAALDAGMRCVALATSFAPESFAAHGSHPDLVVKDFEEFLAGDGAWLRQEA